MLNPKFNSHVYKLKRYNRMKRAKNPGKILWSKPSQERQKGRPKKGQKTCNPQNPKECESQFLVGSYHTNSLNRPPPSSKLWAPLLSLTVQPCGEPCGSAAGFDFLTVRVI
jgi:hypothetical protein